MANLLRKKENNTFIIGSPYFIWVVIFIVVPLIMIFYYGLIDRNGNFTLENIAAIAQPVHLKALRLALWLGVIATVICLIIAYPLAYILSQTSINRYGFVVFLFILPMWMNFLLRTLAWQTLLEKTGVINNILVFLRLPPLNIINTPAAIVLGMVYNFLPFMVLPIYNSLLKIDPNIINAARDLGANSVKVLQKIIFPLSLPGVISGITMVFIPALTTFVISNLLGGSKILLIGNVIEEEFTHAGNWHLGSGLSIVLMLFIIVNMIISSIFDKTGEGNFL
ncbi:MAG: ABC transporter permease [Lachnospiraceae bacterium]|nr:ABC transporter permease [Lachnospiraceae bacterium]